MNYLFVLIIVGLVVESQSVESADNLEKGNATIDREWLSKFLRLLSRPMNPGGEESDPLSFEKLETNDVHNHINDELIVMNISYTNNVIYGLEFAIDNQSINADNLQLYFNAFCDRIKFVGDYAAAGQISAISISGAGPSNITMSDVNTKHTVHFERYEKDGKAFLRVTDYEIKLEPERVHFEYSDLVPGSFFLRGTVNRIINANSRVFFEATTKGVLEENFGSLFKEIANEACSLVPIN